MKNITKNIQVFIYKSLLLTGLFFATQTQAEAEKTIIVFDASGSMWGQIDGKSKIEIAREAFANLKSDWQVDNGGIGLIAYGHNRKGDCSDIEMLVNPSEGDVGLVSDAISSLRPKGKTPLSDAVKMAAQKLKYQEEKATIILFSDGIETCSADPCALSNDLAADGIDFTAHVIGFGLSQDADKEQLRCIAENTGGKYFDANNAQDLNDALNDVTAIAPVVKTEKTVKTSKVTFMLRMVAGSVRPNKMRYVATNLDSHERINLPPLEGTREVLTSVDTELPYGEWKIEIISKEGYGSTNVVVGKRTNDVIVKFKNNEMKLELADNGPYQLGMKQSFYLNAVNTMPYNMQVIIVLLPVNSMKFAERVQHTSLNGKKSNGVSEIVFDSPKIAGNYEIVLAKGYDLTKAFARFPVTYVSHTEPKWNGSLEGAIGGNLPVNISGVMQRYGSLTIENDSTEGNKYQIMELTSTDGVFLPMPDAAGQYDLIYEYRDENNEDQRQNLGKLTVGDITLKDDADSVDAPDAEVSEVVAPVKVNKNPIISGWGDRNTPSNIHEVLRINYPDNDYVKRCENIKCSYDDTILKVKNIPLIDGFSLLGPTLLKNGQLTVTLINEVNGEFVILNPKSLTNASKDKCITGTVNVYTGHADSICSVKNGNVYTKKMREILVNWAFVHNAAILKKQQDDKENPVLVPSNISGAKALSQQEIDQIFKKFKGEK